MSLLDLSKPWERLSPEERSLAKSLGSQLAGHPVTERVGHDLVLADRARRCGPGALLKGLLAKKPVVQRRPHNVFTGRGWGDGPDAA